MSVEELLDDIGGFGRFQVLIITVIFYNKLYMAWSMLQMSFAGYIPDWHCATVAPGFYGNGTVPRDNTTIEACTVNNTLTNYHSQSCHNFHFDESTVTVITEWDLICDRKYIKPLLTSVQMGGVLVGASVAGQLADMLGRRITLYSYILFHVLMNIVTAFSVSWEMFAVGRFLVGGGVGGLLVLVFPFPLEFLPTRWRPVLVMLPAWLLGNAVFAGAAMWLENWSHLHIACALFAVPGLIGFFIVPESMRWLAVKGRIEEAEEVCKKIASINRKEVPLKAKAILQKVYDEEQVSRQNSRKYSYIDVFKGWATLKITLTMCFFWCCMSMIYYGISFGVASFSGNLYLNIFLLAIVELPTQLSTFYLVNKFGRKWVTFTFLLLGCAASIGCLLTHILAPSDIKGEVITGLSLMTKMFIGGGWAVISTWSVELYPTVTRNLGYGACNTSARIGGIVAPYLINFDDQEIMSYSIIATLLLLIALLCTVTPETKGQDLSDSLKTRNKPDPEPTINGVHLQDKGPV